MLTHVKCTSCCTNLRMRTSVLTNEVLYVRSVRIVETCIPLARHFVVRSKFINMGSSHNSGINATITSRTMPLTAFRVTHGENRPTHHCRIDCLGYMKTVLPPTPNVN